MAAKRGASGRFVLSTIAFSGPVVKMVVAPTAQLRRTKSTRRHEIMRTTELLQLTNNLGPDDGVPLLLFENIQQLR